MVQFQDLTRCLLAAGYANHPEGKGVYLLYVEPKRSSLISKHWNGSSFGHQELIATPVRINSTASYLINPSIQLVICISPESNICVLQYNDDEEEWVDAGAELRHVVHPDGKLTAFFGVDNNMRVIFQDPAGRLVYLNEKFQPVILPVDPMRGSPLSSAIVDGRIYAFYVSAKDNCLHYVTEAHPNSWSDKIFAKYAFDQNAKQLVVSIDQQNTFKAYVLTEGNTLLQVANDKMLILGKADETGKFISARSVDRCCNDAWDGVLTANRLKSHLAEDPFIIDTPGGDKFVTPLAAACWRGHLDIVKLLLHEGASPNALSPQKRTALFYLTNRSPTRNRLGIVRALLDAGANVDECYPENNLNTPLMSAIAVIADKDVVHELLKDGASLTATNAQGQTAKMLVEGTTVEPDFVKWTERTPSELETRLVDFMVSFLILVITYINSDWVRKVFNEVVTEVMSRLDEIDSIDNEKYSLCPHARFAALTGDIQAVLKPSKVNITSSVERLQPLVEDFPSLALYQPIASLIP